MKRLFATMCFAAVVVSGCGEAMYRVAGRPFDTSFTQRIVRGKTTKTDVRQALGEPMATSRTIIGGQEADSWAYEYVKRKEGVGEVIIGALDPSFRRVETSRLDIMFQNDIVVDFTYVETGKSQ